MSSKAIPGNAVIGQSGGPTAVINQSLVGVIERLLPCRQVKRLLGAKHAVRGVIREDFIDLKAVRRDLLERVAQTPAAALGSSRDKPDEGYCEKIFEAFASHDVRYFFYIGGNDSADTARIIHEMAAAAKYELRTFHIPKTIDNDLCVTDHCPGYGSAAKYVASVFAGDDRDNASLPGVKINVIMGRHAGWLTAASVLARQDRTDGPHLVYVPEITFHVDTFVEDVREVYGRLGRCQIAVSEGVEDETHTPVAVALAIKLGIQVEYDDHGNPQLSGTGALGDFLADYLKSKLGDGGKGLRVRADTLGYPQRSFAGFVSPVDQAEARLAGQTAAEYAMSGTIDGSVAFRRAPAGKYRLTCFRAELKDVARKIKLLPRHFVNRAGNGITEAFCKYALPLVGPLPPIGKLF